MSTVSSSLATGGPSERTAISVRLFSSRFRVLWLALVCATVGLEIVPCQNWPPTVFYFYFSVKVVGFFALGFLSPLTFRSLNGLGLGLLLAFSSALAFETLQGFWHRGHSFEWWELGGKLFLIGLGFAVALEKRYSKKLTVGPWRFQFITD